MSELDLLLRALPVPPLSLFLLAAFGFLLGRRHPRFGRSLVAMAGLLMFLMCIPAIANALLGSLETPSEIIGNEVGDAAAIIVLSADIDRDAPEYDGTSIGGLTLARLRYGAFLARRFHLPILVTGGNAELDAPPVAPAMARVLKDEFGLEARWVEDKSANTYENAVFSARILEADGIRTALLVTHSWHMPRALLSFAQAGFAVRPAPTEFTSHFRGHVDELLPSAHAFQGSSFAIHEWLGLSWYWLTGGPAHTRAP